MSTLGLCIVCCSSGGAIGWSFGYFIPRLYARAVAKAVQRERVVAALAGQQVPSWEQTARELEAAAVAQAKQGMPSTSRTLLDQAADVRARGKADR